MYTIEIILVAIFIILVAYGLIYIMLRALGRISDKGGKIRVSKNIELEGSEGLILVTLGTVFLLIFWSLYTGHPIIPESTPAPTLIATPTPIITPTSTPTTATATPSSAVTSLHPAEDGGTTDARWQKIDLGSTFVEQQHLVIGGGRNDGVMRVYSGDGDCCAGRIYEFSFINNRWQKINIVADNSDVNTIYGLEFGNVRNDGVNRVYASGYDLAEYYYASDSWLGGEVDTDIQWTNDLVLGDARNDGYVRMYVAMWNGIHEISYNYGDWDVKEIDTGSQAVEKLLITDGRNDGTLRLYAAVNGHIFEYSWSGNTWQVEDCGAVGGQPYILYCDMAAGNGRNDGINRIYLTSGGLYELTYDGGKWDYISIASANDRGVLTISNGRNDGINRLYTGSSKGVGEYTYTGFWAKTSNIETDYEVNGLAVGNGRNDGVNRIYVTGNDNHVYEYSIG